MLSICDMYPGWTWDYVAEYITVPRMNKIFAHYGNCPPLRMIAAAMAGIDLTEKTTAEEKAVSENEKNMAQLMAYFPQRG